MSPLCRILQRVNGFGNVARATEEDGGVFGTEGREPTEWRALDLDRPGYGPAEIAFALKPAPQQPLEFLVELVDIAVALKNPALKPSCRE